MMRTRMINKAFGTTYSFEEIAEKDNMEFMIAGWLLGALFPPKSKKA